MKLVIKAFVVWCTIWAAPTFASDFYASMAAAVNRIDIADDEVKPFVGTLKLGYEFADNFALEIQYGMGMDDDENSLDQKIKVDSQGAAFLRIGSGSAYNNVRLYLLAGYSQTELSVDGENPTDDDKYDGFAWGVGAEEFLQSIRKLAFVAEYYRYYNRNEVTIDAISLGFRYKF
ncbi:porin family protein [Kaarinaea lacus]